MIYDKVVKLLCDQLPVKPEQVTRDSRLFEDLKADSLDVVELIMDLEQQYGIEIPDDDLPNIHTVGDIVNYINKK